MFHHRPELNCLDCHFLSQLQSSSRVQMLCDWRPAILRPPDGYAVSAAADASSPLATDRASHLHCASCGWFVVGGILVGYHVETLQHEKKSKNYIFNGCHSPNLDTTVLTHLQIPSIVPFESNLSWATDQESDGRRLMNLRFSCESLAGNLQQFICHCLTMTRMTRTCK